MKIYSSILLSFFTILILLPLNIFACACCADPGYYKIGFQKPSSYELGEMKKLKFGGAKIYSTPAFPEDIKGLNPISEEYKVIASKNTYGWHFNFTDEKGNSGSVDLKMPKKFIQYAVDTRSGEKGGAGSVVLYKEWRFKYKVSHVTGIFKDGLKGKTEYFLVLQGKGNACTSAGNFTHWRLEVTGKKANYAFYGSLKADDANAKSSETKDQKDSIKVANLTGTNYVGCGCSGLTLKEAKKQGKKQPFFWSEFKANGESETLFLNLNDKDTELILVKKGERPEKEKVGDRFTDEYVADGTKVILDYVTKKLPCEGCEGTDYDVTATIVGKYNGKVISLLGSCGC